VAKAAAWLDGADAVLPCHLEPLAHVLWDEPSEQPAKCAEVVGRIANPVGAEVNRILADADGVLATLTGTEFTPETAAGIKKLDECLKRLAGLNGNGRAVKAREYLKGRVMDVRKRLLGIGG
jgi:hypothetical protein